MQSTIAKAVEEFLAFAIRLKQNAWHQQPGVLDIYCRRSHHNLNHKLCSTFDIANCEVAPAWRGRGLLEELLESLELLIASSPDMSDIKAIYLENVLPEPLRAFYLRMGYTQVDARTLSGTWPPSFYKVIR